MPELFLHQIPSGQPRENLCTALRLMLHLDQLRSAFRGHSLAKAGQGISVVADLAYFTMTIAAQIAEAARTLKDEVGARRLDPDIVQDDPSLTRLLSDLTASSTPEFFREVHRVRDKFLSHADRQKVSEFVDAEGERMTSVAIISLPAADSAAGTYPWARMVAIHVATGLREKEFKEFGDELQTIAPRMIRLLDRFASSLLRPLVAPV